MKKVYLKEERQFVDDFRIESGKYLIANYKNEVVMILIRSSGGSGVESYHFTFLNNFNSVVSGCNIREAADKIGEDYEFQIVDRYELAELMTSIILD